MNLVAIYDLLNEYFSLDDIREIVFMLGHDYDNLSGDTKRRKIQSLVQTLSNNNEMERLKTIVLEKRSFLTWPADSSPTPPQPGPNQRHQHGIQLEGDDRTRLVRILATMPEFRLDRSRVGFVDEIFEGVPRGDDIRMLLDLSGTPRGAASALIIRLCNFGQNEPGQEVLGLLINKMIEYFGGGDDVDFLRGLFLKYPLNVAPVISKGLDDWGGGPVTLSTLKEKIIGEDTLKPIHILELALDASHAVVRIRDEEGTGTGFLVGERLIMTNHHVIQNGDNANRTYFDFNYQLDRQREEKALYTVKGKQGGLFYANAKLDFTLIEIEEVPEYATPLTLSYSPIQQDARINIIQHPAGHYKKISMQNNIVASFNVDTLYYVTSTMPGSSGSPIFDNDRFVVVGIHHSSTIVQESDDASYERNAGSRMSAVLADIKLNVPDLYQQLTIQ